MIRQQDLDSLAQPTKDQAHPLGTRRTRNGQPQVYCQAVSNGSEWFAIGIGNQGPVSVVPEAKQARTGTNQP